MASRRPNIVPDQEYGYGQVASKSGPECRVPNSPATPSQNGAGWRDASKFDIWFLEFSNEYSLNLRRPSPSVLGIHTGTPPYDEDSWFYNSLKSQYCQGNAHAIHATFDKEAREIHSRWVKKVKGQHDVTAPLTTLPRVSTESERASLIKCLADILDTSRSPSGTRHSKRPSGKGSSHSPSPKRSRASSFSACSRLPSIPSRLDSGEVRALTPAPGPTASLALRDPRPSPRQDMGSFALSVNSSRSSFVSRTFTESDDPNSDFEFPGTQDTEVTNVHPSRSPRPSNPVPGRPFHERLRDVWPVLPTHLLKAPLAVRWEIMRVFLYFEIPMDEQGLQYHPDMNDQTTLWKTLRGLSAFRDKDESFPEMSRPEAWNAAMTDSFSSTDQVVVLTASLDCSPAKMGPLFKPKLQPLKLDLPHRLDRRFGSDRFLEVVMPSLHTKVVRKLSKDNESALIDSIHKWLVEDAHFLLGRAWKSFYTKPSTSKTPKKTKKDDTPGPEGETIMQERIYLFAEDGNDFLRTGASISSSAKHESSNSHIKMERGHLIDWLLQIGKNKKNQEQSIYKLFSRIALGLSRTRPTVVLEPHQIRFRDADIRSPANKVMNDGIARMSTALARMIRDAMGLDSIPAGYQGRFGSAKGFWIRDTEDTSDEIWIETYPSQRKWICDFEDDHHRTFEVRNEAKELKSAALNLQLLPILEDRATDKETMKELVGKFLKSSLESEIESQKKAMQDPADFRLWVHENTASQRRQDRIKLGHVPWIAGLPASREDQMEMLLSQGFDPTKLEFLRKIAFDLREKKCEELQTRLNVKVGRSTYAYMVVDFSGVLEEDEVHLGFSSKFTDEQSGFSETFLHGMDVLVARTPAHYPSDIQRVKAVFKPELGSLKDVIVFSTKGDIPLADKLSGGDYDGDMAWVCWEPDIVNNFTNAPLPNAPDLFADRVLSKAEGTYESLARSCGSTDVTTEFLGRAFRFNMESNLLGTCTNYKEKLCYSRNSVSDEHAVFLSTLISHLVDRAKQGIIFSERDWDRVRRDRNAHQQDVQRARKRFDPPQPQYKNNNWAGNGPPTHIIDYVKFVVGKPTVKRELDELHRYLGQAEHYDEDLVKYAEHYDSFKRPKAKVDKDEAAGKFGMSTWEIILDNLEKSMKAVAAHWPHGNDDKFEARLKNMHAKWQDIEPTGVEYSKTVEALRERNLCRVGLSPWDLLKASYCFKWYCKKSPRFPWYMAGYQLAYLKSIATSQGRDAPPILLTPDMYAGMRPDAKFVRAVAALRDNRHYNQLSDVPEDAENSSDEDGMPNADYS